LGAVGGREEKKRFRSCSTGQPLVHQARKTPDLAAKRVFIVHVRLGGGHPRKAPSSQPMDMKPSRKWR